MAGQNVKNFREQLRIECSWTWKRWVEKRRKMAREGSVKLYCSCDIHHHHHHHHHHHLFWKRSFFHAKLGVRRLPQIKSLHTSLKTAHSECKPSIKMSRKLTANRTRHYIISRAVLNLPSIWTGISPLSMALSLLISSWYSLSMASFGSSFIFGLFFIFLARLA